MKRDSDPPKPKLKLSRPKKTGEDGPSAPPTGSPKTPPPVAKELRKNTAPLKKPGIDPDVIAPVELEPADEVFWEVFEMDNLGFPEEGKGPQNADVADAPPPPVKTLGNASLDDFFFNEDKTKLEDVSHFGANMLIGDSEDQIARGPGRLTPEDDHPKRPPPPLNAPVLPHDELDERAPRLSEEEPDEPDEFDFLASESNADAQQPEEGSRTDEDEAETSPLRGRRFWVTLGLVAAIAGASAFTLSITREGRPSEQQAFERATAVPNAAVSAPIRVTVPSAPTVLTESPDGIRTPETTAALQSLVDGFLISVAYPGGNRPRIVINEVTVPVGEVLDPYTALRLVQIQEEPRTLIFEDGGGQTYTRPF